MIKFNLSNFTIDAAGPDGLPRRTITGVAVEYNTFATVSDGTRIQFAPGSLPVDGRPPRVLCTMTQVCRLASLPRESILVLSY